MASRIKQEVGPFLSHASISGTVSGYKGLYNGETADDIAKRKGLRYREDILDNMGSEELAANLFRITQTESRLSLIHI